MIQTVGGSISSLPNVTFQGCVHLDTSVKQCNVLKKMCIEHSHFKPQIHTRLITLMLSVVNEISFGLMAVQEFTNFKAFRIFLGLNPFNRNF